MSIILEPDHCNCSCHRPGARILHCAPCCEGLCQYCNHHIKRDLAGHIGEKHPWVATMPPDTRSEYRRRKPRHPKRGG